MVSGLEDCKILITGGTGSLGNALIPKLSEYNKIIVFSRDEYKQHIMAQKFSSLPNIRFLIGDVRDLDRLKQAMRGVDIVVHAAALKHIPTAEYNPTEAIKTNIDGTRNVVDACIECEVKRAVFTSTDKAVAPINLYGSTKLTGEKLWLAANSYCKTAFRVVRYGNVLNSRGSVIELFMKLKEKGIREFPITDVNMTRFWITLDEAACLVVQAIINDSPYIHIPDIPSMKITDVARAIDPDCTFKEIGIREGEKLHESLSETFHSNENKNWLTAEELKGKLRL